MLTLAQLTSTDAQAGRVVWIGLRPLRRVMMTSVEKAVLTEAGITGDHARPGPRALTLFQSEHLPVLASFLGRDAIAPQDLRRNIHVAGLNLSAMRGARLSLGATVIEITAPCAPCSRMAETFGPGGYNALRGHGGWCARIVQGGALALDDPVARIGDDNSGDPIGG